MVKPWLDPITAAKISVISYEAAPDFNFRDFFLSLKLLSFSGQSKIAELIVKKKLVSNGSPSQPFVPWP